MRCTAEKLADPIQPSLTAMLDGSMLIEHVVSMGHAFEVLQESIPEAGAETDAEDVERELREFVSFARDHLPERFEVAA